MTARCPVKLFLDGLAPFPVSFQHSSKLFLGALVIFKGAGRFTAHWVNDMSILVLAGELVKAVFVGKPLNNDSQHIFVLLVFFEPTLSSEVWRFGNAPECSNNFLIMNIRARYRCSVVT